MDFLSKRDEIFFLISFLNKSKLNIYNDAISLFLRKFDIKLSICICLNIVLVFILSIKSKFFQQIKIIGYQHGIFSENLMWFDVLKSIRNKKKFTEQNYFIKYL